MSTDAPSYKDTLNLPKTSFDMKANLLQREPAMLRQWEAMAASDAAHPAGLYQRIQAARHGSPKGKWVLHDGPPYANGDIHMGHLINKVLKDIVVKFRTMEGYASPYVPGWDCHGLPIESAIQKELGPKMRELGKDQIRQKCQAYAMKYVKLQSEGFKRLGVLGDYERPYLTLDPRYEGGILDVLAELVDRNLVYRQKKPVHWCTFDRTALAEAELEYADRKDHSIYVSFALDPRNTWPAPWWDFLQARSKANQPLAPELMIWTTTPWTLPANRAVAIHPEYEYVCVVYLKANPALGGEETLHAVIIAKRLVDTVMAAGGITHYQVSPPVSGAEWVAMKPRYFHPLDEKRSLVDGLLQPVVLADYVTLEDGTGLVHTAPGHGVEDYQTGKREGLEIYNPVLPDGKYDDTVPAFLHGSTIWDANRLVIDHLQQRGSLFRHVEFTHSYPHCWRCKKPVIFRATEQWFVKASAGGESPLWENALAYVKRVQWIPAWGQNRIEGMLQTRPDWCISRQRSWGVPIPAFFTEKGEVVLTVATVRRVADYFRARGADRWYTDTPAQLLGLEAKNGPALSSELQSLGLSPTLDLAKLDKGQDILDVWFESGASHHAVLECTHPELGYPAAMYLEGSDQHRGWFHSSLLEAAGYKQEPPYRQVLTHGFVVDEKGRKMSKSEGNDIKVADALKKYGADILRLWVASVDYQNDIPCGWSLFDKTSDAYRKIRNTMRYLLGNLYDFDPARHLVAPRPHSIDRWMQNRVDAWAAEVYAAYDHYEFHKVFKLIYEFCNVEISATYAKAIKDRLYCELPDAPKRRASQSVCYRALVRLIELSAPVLVFTAEEAWTALRALPGDSTLEPSIHLHLVSPPAPAPENDASWAVLMPLVESGNKQLDELKRSVGLGNPLDAEAEIHVPAGDPLAALMADYGPEIEDTLGCGYHRIVQAPAGSPWTLTILDTRQKYPSCARSWKRRPDVGRDPRYPDLSARDAAAVAILRGSA